MVFSETKILSIFFACFCYFLIFLRISLSLLLSCFFKIRPDFFDFTETELVTDDSFETMAAGLSFLEVITASPWFASNGDTVGT